MRIVGSSAREDVLVGRRPFRIDSRRIDLHSTESLELEAANGGLQLAAQQTGALQIQKINTDPIETRKETHRHRTRLWGSHLVQTKSFSQALTREQRGLL